MKLPQFILILSLSIFTFSVYSQSGKRCCDDPACSQPAQGYAVRVTGLTGFLGNCADDTAVDGPVFRHFKATRPEQCEELVKLVKTLDNWFFGNDHQYSDPDCLTNAFPTASKANVLCWINYIRFNVLGITSKFPSTEFCVGWKKRLEIAQGASAFLSKSKMEYLGALRAYLIYTFKGKEKCGGTFRLMAGPAYFLRSSESYLALSTRLGIRITDLRDKSKVFSFGNLNFFGGYNTNFDHFNYAEGGFEVELGPFGVNLSGNYNTTSEKAGFLVGLVFANTPFKKKKPKS